MKSIEDVDAMVESDCSLEEDHEERGQHENAIKISNYERVFAVFKGNCTEGVDAMVESDCSLEEDHEEQGQHEMVLLFSKVTVMKVLEIFHIIHVLIFNQRALVIKNQRAHTVILV